MVIVKQEQPGGCCHFNMKDNFHRESLCLQNIDTCVKQPRCFEHVSGLGEGRGQRLKDRTGVKVCWGQIIYELRQTQCE